MQDDTKANLAEVKIPETKAESNPPIKTTLEKGKIVSYIIISSMFILALLAFSYYLFFIELPSLRQENEYLNDRINTANEVTSLMKEVFDNRLTKLEIETKALKASIAALKVKIRQTADANIKPKYEIDDDLVKRLLEGGRPTEEIAKDLEKTLQALPPAYVRDMITKLTDLSNEDMPEDDDELSPFAIDLFKVVSGESVRNVVDAPPEIITFSTQVKWDNSPISPTSIFKSTDRRLYACFSNKGELLHLSKVITRWTNKWTNQIEYLSSKPINQDSKINYIWVEKKDGWTLGEYEVELIQTKTLEKVASGTFIIQK